MLMRKIKLCIITTLAVTLEAFVIPAAEFLSDHGYQITLVSNMNQSFVEKYKGRFNCVTIPMGRGVDPMKGPLAIWRMIRLFNKERFDIVQYATPNASLYGATASFLSMIPGRLYCQWGIRYVGFRGTKRKVFRWIEKITCLLSTHISPASTKNKEFAICEGLYPQNKADVIGSGGTIGVDLTVFNEDRKTAWRNYIRERFGIKESVVFGFVGSVRKEKGVNELLAAFKIVSQEINNATLLVLGDELSSDPLDSELRLWSRKCSSVHYCGNVGDAHTYIAAMDVIVHPSYREGFSMVLQEASALAVPAITTDIPGPSEVVEKDLTGMLVPPMNIKELALAMLKLSENKSLRNRMGAAALDRARRLFSREIMLYETLRHRNRVFKET